MKFKKFIEPYLKIKYFIVVLMIYNCEFCNYSAKIKTHFNRHLNTRKHKINIYKCRRHLSKWE